MLNLRRKNYQKKYTVLKKLYQALLLQAAAIEEGNTEDVVFYARFIREETDHLCSLETVISALDNRIAYAVVENYPFQALYENISMLQHANMDALQVSVKSIKKQLSSILLLTKGHSQYNGSSLPEYIDITR